MQRMIQEFVGVVSLMFVLGLIAIVEVGNSSTFNP
jgi:hypothetical protein